MKKLIIAVALLAIFALLPLPAGATDYTAVSVTASCPNVSVTLSTDKTNYQYTETANLTVLINNTPNSDPLDEILLIELYHTDGSLAAYMDVDNATAAASGMNTTSYYRNLSDISSGNYTLRARIADSSLYPGENMTIHDCSSDSAVQSDVNITVTQQKPNAPTNFKLILNTTSNDTTLNWTLSTSTDVFNYVIYKTDTWANGFNYSNPYQTVSNDTYNWTDPTSDGVDQRYYIIRANNTLGLTDDNTDAVGKYNLKLYTGWNLISLPLLIWNSSMNDVFYTAEGADICDRFVGSTQQYQSTDYYAGFGWSGQFATAQVDRGYWYYSRKEGYVTTPFNNTIVGAVPSASRSETIYPNKWSMLGWTSVNTKTLNSVFTNAANSDIIDYFNAPTDTFRSSDYYEGYGWSGQFSTITPSRGYWYYSRNATQYTWAYTP